MSVHTILKCDGVWGPEKQPCRAAFVVPGTVSYYVWHDARKAGWTCDATLGDLCPAHTRLSDPEEMMLV